MEREKEKFERHGTLGGCRHVSEELFWEGMSPGASSKPFFFSPSLLGLFVLSPCSLLQMSPSQPIAASTGAFLHLAFTNLRKTQEREGEAETENALCVFFCGLLR